MAKAFLSHSSKQGDLVAKVADKLGRDNCVLDKYHFNSGDPTLKQIIENINKTDLFVLFLSEEAIQSEWVKRELEHATQIQELNSRKQLLVINIDVRLRHTDDRLPKWLKEQYNLKPLTEHIIIYKRIDSHLRDILLSRYPKIKIREELFIGRNHLMEEFEGKYYTLNGIKPSCIIASGMEGVGRRKFITQALDKVKKMNKYHNSISITLDSRNSIEDFILNIEDLNSKNIIDDILPKVSGMSLQAKVEYSRELLNIFKREGEILFIIDKGCIVQPNKELAGWFSELISHRDFENCTVLCLISTIRPVASKLRPKEKFLWVHVNELSIKDIQVLFIRACEEINQATPPQQITEQILPLLNGMPDQVFFAVDLIKEEGSAHIHKHYEDLKKHNDIRVFSVFEQIKERGSLYKEVLVFLATLNFVSYKTVYLIFGRSPEVESILEHLLAYGVYDQIGGERENIQVHGAITDYIKRLKIPLEPSTRDKLRTVMATSLKDGSDQPDISQIILTVKSMLIENKAVPDKLLIPSFILRSIVDHYYDEDYNSVESLAERILGYNNKFDQSILREIRYWLCQALARKYAKARGNQHEKFFEHLNHFHGSDYHFLMGFYYRLNKRWTDAEKSYRQALNIDENSQKTKRELVTVLLTQNKYQDAFKLARENYVRRPLNGFHIQAYFICLTRKHSSSSKDREEIKELLKAMDMSHDRKASEMKKCMTAEAKYYIEGNLEGAIKSLEQLISEVQYKSYPRRALLEIYRRRGMRSAEQEIEIELIRSNEMDTPLIED